MVQSPRSRRTRRVGSEGLYVATVKNFAATQGVYFQCDKGPLATQFNVAGTVEPGTKVRVAFGSQRDEVFPVYAKCAAVHRAFLQTAKLWRADTAVLIFGKRDLKPEIDHNMQAQGEIAPVKPNQPWLDSATGRATDF